MAVTRGFPVKDRHARLLELLPKHNYKVLPAAVEAGFTYSTANTQGKSLLRTAMKKQEEHLRSLPKGERLTLAKKLGITRAQLVENINWLATQERDLATRFKVVKAIAKDEDIDLSDDDDRTTVVPTLNITVKERTETVAQPSPVSIDPPSVEE